MKEQAAKIQIVINTLETLDIPATFDNVNRMTGIYQLLTGLRDELAGMEGEAKDDGREAEAG